jgi:hypothetical protein
MFISHFFLLHVFGPLVSLFERTLNQVVTCVPGGPWPRKSGQRGEKENVSVGCFKALVNSLTQRLYAIDFTPTTGWIDGRRESEICNGQKGVFFVVDKAFISLLRNNKVDLYQITTRLRLEGTYGSPAEFCSFMEV